MRRVATQLAVAIGMITSASLCGAVDLDRQIQFEIPAQKLDAALMEFSRQAKIQIVASTPNLSDYQTTGAKGTLTIGEALGRLLGDSGLAIKEVGEETLAIVASKSEVATTTRVADVSSMVRVASLTTQPEDPLPAASTPQDATSVPKKIELEEVVVTGSHIRGAQNLSAPVIRFDREDIERSGYSTTQQFIQSLPQNFNSISETTFGNINGGQTPGGHVSAVNLRGIGGDSTLVLINGRRVAQSVDGSVVDISLIPVALVERIEVLADGASAIYGSDAIGGVFNIVLRDGYDGAETRLRYGAVTAGAGYEYQLGQTLGTSWGSGSAFASADYYHREPTSSLDRSFIDDDRFAFDLSPKQQRQSVIGGVSQQVSDRVRLSADGFFSRRESDFQYSISGTQFRNVADLWQASGTLAAKVDLGNRWTLDLSGVHSQSESLSESFMDGVRSADPDWSAAVSVADIMAEGPAFSAPGGATRLAVGGQFRHEELDPSQSSLDRDISAGYAEVFVPLVGANNRRALAERLDVSGAIRYEHYSDFGASTSPKIGLSWSPVAPVNVRATYGKSFKAPRLADLMVDRIRATVYDLVDPAAPTGFTPALLLAGSSASLGPEKASTWTAGIDFEPSIAPGLAVQATYFSVDIDSRVARPVPDDARLFTVLIDPLYEQFITRPVQPATVAPYFDIQSFFNGSAMATSPADIGALVDSRLINIARHRLDGVDFTADYRVSTIWGDLGMRVLGTYMLGSEQRVVPGAAEQDMLNGVFQPVDLKVRASASWSRGPVNLTSFVNYTDGYRDNRDPNLAGPGQRRRVSSWVTFDMTVDVDLGSMFPTLGAGSKVAITAINVVDRHPPFISSPIGMHFDGANAEPIGRTLALQITKSW